MIQWLAHALFRRHRYEQVVLTDADRNVFSRAGRCTICGRVVVSSSWPAR